MRAFKGVRYQRGFLGALVGGLLSNWGSHEQNQASEHMMEKQQAWEMKMSNTAHRREVRDLYAAGLNPILSATGGAGASTPSVSAPSLENEMGPGISSALSVARTKEELDLIRNQADAAKEDAIIKRKTPDLMVEQMNQASANARNLDTDSDKKEAEVNLTKQMLETEKYRTNSARSISELDALSVPGARNEAAFEESSAGGVAKAVRRIRESLFGNSASPLNRR